MTEVVLNTPHKTEEAGSTQPQKLAYFTMGFRGFDVVLGSCPDQRIRMKNHARYLQIDTNRGPSLANYPVNQILG